MPEVEDFLASLERFPFNYFCKLHLILSNNCFFFKSNFCFGFSLWTFALIPWLDHLELVGQGCNNYSSDRVHPVDDNCLLKDFNHGRDIRVHVVEEDIHAVIFKVDLTYLPGEVVHLLDAPLSLRRHICFLLIKRSCLAEGFWGE